LREAWVKQFEARLSEVWNFIKNIHGSSIVEGLLVVAPKNAFLGAGNPITRHYIWYFVGASWEGTLLAPANNYL
jgi:hypothetical protein